MRLDMRDTWSKDRNLADFTPAGYSTALPPTTSAESEGILTHMYQFYFVNMYTLNDYRVLSLFE